MAPQKRTAQEADSLTDGIKALVVDIEGTTTPISFVKETLFPYIKDNLDTYLDKHYDDTETQKDIAALRTLASKDKEESVSGVVEIPDVEASKEDIVKAVAENVRWQMSSDRKSTELKQFQGRMLQEGYKLGTFKGELYDDVPGVLRQLADEGLKLYVFSSGSIQAQKLLFANTKEGDLTDLFTGFFDTTTGSKTESSSYTKIQEEIECDADEIRYLTDSVDEARAAATAGLRCTLVIRPENGKTLNDDLQNVGYIERFEELLDDDDYDEDQKRFEGDNGEADEDEDDPDDDEDDEENPDEDEDA